MRDIEPDPIQVIWDEFEAGGTPESARLRLLGRSFYVAARPQMRPEQMAELRKALLNQSVAEVQQRFQLSRRRLYEIKRKLKLG